MSCSEGWYSGADLPNRCMDFLPSRALAGGVRPAAVVPGAVADSNQPDGRPALLASVGCTDPWYG